MVFVDLSKVDFRTLILKLSSIGFSTGSQSSLAFKLLESYLTCSSHFAQIDDKVSELGTVRFAVNPDHIFVFPDNQNGVRNNC